MTHRNRLRWASQVLALANSSTCVSQRSYLRLLPESSPIAYGTTWVSWTKHLTSLIHALRKRVIVMWCSMQPVRLVLVRFRSTCLLPMSTFWRMVCLLLTLPILILSIPSGVVMQVWAIRAQGRLSVDKTTSVSYLPVCCFIPSKNFCCNCLASWLSGLSLRAFS